MYKVKYISKVFIIILLVISTVGINSQMVHYHETFFLCIEYQLRTTLRKKIGFSLFGKVLCLFYYLLYITTKGMFLTLKRLSEGHSQKLIEELEISCASSLPKTFEEMMNHSEVVEKYNSLFSLLNFRSIPQRRFPKGCKGHPLSAYIKALIVQIEEAKSSSEKLRDFLLQNPPLIIFLGFRPHLDENSPYGFNPQKTVPTSRHLRRKLQQIENPYLRNLLFDTVKTLVKLGIIKNIKITVSMDTKEVWAHVKENNPKLFVKDRYDKNRILKGDKDAKLGAKEISNKKNDDKNDDANKEKDNKKIVYFWGYKNGAVVIKTPFGEFTLSETTKTANTPDVKFFFPLIKPVSRVLKLKVLIFIADAAYDAWYVYDYIKSKGGTAYIPLNNRGHDTSKRKFGPNGGIICSDGKEMTFESSWFDEDKGYRRRRDTCPIPCKKSIHFRQSCSCNKFKNGKGCKISINLDDLDQIRFHLDRKSIPFKNTYKKRTASERIFSQTDNYSIQKPIVRNLNSVKNRNSLIHILINLKAIQRAIPFLEADPYP